MVQVFLRRWIQPLSRALPSHVSLDKPQKLYDHASLDKPKHRHRRELNEGVVRENFKTRSRYQASIAICYKCTKVFLLRPSKRGPSPSKVAPCARSVTRSCC